MEMEDHTHHNHTQYGIDLRQFMGVRPSQFPPIPHPPPPDHHPIFGTTTHHRSQQLQPPPQHHQFDMMMLMPRGGGGGGGGLPECGGVDTMISANTCGNSTAGSTSSTVAAASVSASAAASLSGLDCEGGSFGADGGTGRWPRQETLTLLEIRSRLDSKFKEANQKGPLWDEVSRIMSEEHGYQRSGKKCREKFENLYKYYKKTKEGKAGRQDGKHYRFFRQLEALYGETSNPNSVQDTLLAGNSTSSLPFHTITTTTNHPQKLCDSLSLSYSSEFDTSSSEENEESAMENDSSEKMRRKRRGAKGWKSKIKEFIDMQMRKLMERQEAWLEKLTKTLEQKEQERLFREEEWRRQEAARIDREHKFWAKERAWIEARDAALMEAFQKITERDHHHQHQAVVNNNASNSSPDDEDLNETESEIRRKVEKDCSKKRKENSRNCCYIPRINESGYNPAGGGGGGGYCDQSNEVASSPANSNAGQNNESCAFPFLMSDGENLWENYGLNLKLINKGGEQSQ